MFQVQPLSQNDPRWKNNLLGNNNSNTIGKFGCLLTSLTMVVNGYGGNETPSSLNDKMKAVGGFQDDLIVPALIPRVQPNIRYLGIQDCNGNAPLSAIDSNLSAGRPVVIEVDFSPSPGLQNHWVVIVDKSGSEYLIADPYPYPLNAAPVPLSQRYGFAGSPANIIKSAIWFDSTEAQAPKTVPIPTSGLKLYPSVDGLALRQQPIITPDNLISRLPLNEALYVSEDPAAAQGKVGQQGQWIQVIETARGYQGYVAAWYVSSTQTPQIQLGDAPQAPSQPPESSPSPANINESAVSTGSQPLILYSMANGLSLRSQPVVDSSTLLKREPLNAQFVVLEDPLTASVKIGVMNQWLQVRDIQGDQGYVAAWYISRFVQAALGAIPQPSSAPSTLPSRIVVRASQDNLALRSQPVIDDSTIIRRYPAQTEFLIQEPASQALAKIGQVNLWLNVCTIDGQAGYVAAWFVTLRPDVT